MCGISGIYHPDNLSETRRQLVQSMTANLIHRGPDEDGFYLSPHLTLGMRRLKVIDLNTGSQPISNETGTVHIILNGEIYRFENLRKQLEKAGHVFRTKTDTEVLVHLYEEYGLSFFDHFDGMFTFALWDEQRHRLIIGRDKFGIKPLFYTVPCPDNVFAFCSELSPLLQLPWLSKTLDPAALDRFFALSYIPHPWTIYKDIRKLSPGSYLLAEKDRIENISYWDLSSFAAKGISVATPEELDSAISSAVVAMMRSDVSVGAFLSGGLDSGTVVYHLAQHTSHPIHTFSIRYKEKSFDEGNEARLTADMLGTRHHEIWVGPEDINILPSLNTFFGEPFADPSQIPTYFLSRLARQEVTVALSGDGGDEILGGYETYCASLFGDITENIPESIRKTLLLMALRIPVSLKHVSWDYKIKKFLTGCNLPPLERHTAWRTIFNSSEREELYTPAFASFAGNMLDAPVFAHWGDLFRKNGCDRLTQYQYLDIKTYLTDNNLAKVDRMSMANSLEVRIPFLDAGVAQTSLRLPSKDKVDLLKTKIVLRRLMRQRLPESVLRMRKKGFAVPLGHWFKGALDKFVAKSLNPAKVASTKILRPETVEKIIKTHQLGRANMTRQIWNLICFMNWYENKGTEIMHD